MHTTVTRCDWQRDPQLQPTGWLTDCRCSLPLPLLCSICRSRVASGPPLRPPPRWTNTSHAHQRLQGQQQRRLRRQEDRASRRRSSDRDCLPRPPLQPPPSSRMAMMILLPSLTMLRLRAK